MMTSNPIPVILPNAYIPATDLARDLLNKYEINPTSLKEAADTILLLRAQANVSGYKMENELIRLSNILIRYEELTHALHDIAEEKV